MASKTLDTNDDAFLVSVGDGQYAVVGFTITGTCTITLTAAIGEVTGLPTVKADGSTNAVWTATPPAPIVIDRGGSYTFTASSISGGGECEIDVEYFRH